MASIDQFRRRVIQSSLFAPCSLTVAMGRLGFLQADPIRSPARAQDLILRHRVRNYRAGDLERAYPNLGLEEGYLYAYGFTSPDLWRALHPKSDVPFTKAQHEVLELVQRLGPMHPKEVEAHLGGERTRNCWGGYSRTAKMTLESLHSRGAVRVAHREKGIRIYEAAEVFHQEQSHEERFQKLLLMTLKALGATTRTFLLSELSHFGFLVGTVGERKRCLQTLIDDGRIRLDVVDSVEYLSLADTRVGRRSLDQVRILAPFDPIVRDRARFEHLWGWSYRFEAYTPKAKRKLGYYAMPVLWQDRIVGWANVSVMDKKLSVELGYVEKCQSAPGFRQALEEELSKFAQFLGLNVEDWRVNL